MPTPIPQELTERITFLDPSGAYHAVTGVAANSTDVVSVWARITELGGSVEAVDQQHEAQTQGFEIWTQYLEQVNGFMQIRWDSRGGIVLTISEVPKKIVDRNGRRWTMLVAERATERDP